VCGFVCYRLTYTQSAENGHKSNKIEADILKSGQCVQGANNVTIVRASETCIELMERSQGLQKEILWQQSGEQFSISVLQNATG
jgi:hypothetical protein